jgi:hypothetical protein
VGMVEVRTYLSIELKSLTLHSFSLLIILLSMICVQLCKHFVSNGTSHKRELRS